MAGQTAQLEVVEAQTGFAVHVCPQCGHTIQRDQNSALVVLIDAHTPGTGVAARPKPLARQRAKSKSLTRETPRYNDARSLAVGEFMTIYQQLI